MLGPIAEHPIWSTAIHTSSLRPALILFLAEVRPTNNKTSKPALIPIKKRVSMIPLIAWPVIESQTQSIYKSKDSIVDCWDWNSVLVDLPERYCGSTLLFSDREISPDTNKKTKCLKRADIVFRTGLCIIKSINNWQAKPNKFDKDYPLITVKLLIFWEQ